MSFVGGILEDELPKPKPRQRTLKFSTNTESESLPERPLTSSVFISLSPTETDSTTNGTFHNSSPQVRPFMPSKSSSDSGGAVVSLGFYEHGTPPGLKYMSLHYVAKDRGPISQSRISSR